MLKFLVPLILLSQNDCGRPSGSQRIVGGTDSAAGEWPWQVSLQGIEGLQCGGSLITNSWVLTASHCFLMSLTSSEYTIYLGVHQLSDLQKPGVVVRGVKQIVVHPDFGKGSGHDIALVELETPVNFASSILPVSLPSDSVPLPVGTLCWATGWGLVQTEEQLPSPKTLQKVQVALMDNKYCESLYQSSMGYSPKYKMIQADMLCAGYKEGMKDPCQVSPY
ncbi:serine protease 27-like isoform X2 [Dendropsophus ebraccatus]|uniref:serine protease 27-like isoform X2 n=1 Tax=Dendropsophus ebraccatus TaxID=150705 RepID=UPI0038318538